MQNPVLQARLMAYLKSWYTTSTDNQRKANVEVQLTFDDFLTLVKPHQKRKLKRAINAGNLFQVQNTDSDLAYVLTWRSYSAKTTNVFNLATAEVTTRRLSELNSRIKKGDKMRPGHRAKISESLKGQPKTAEHAENISAGKKGVKIAKWTPERKAKWLLARHGKQS